MNDDTISATLAIRELALRYAQAVDRCDFTALAALCCADAEQLIPFLDVHYRGRDEIAKGCSVVADMFERTYHAVHNHLVDLAPAGATAGEASGEVYCVAMHFSEVDGRKIKLDMGLRYLDRYRLEADGWRFSRRELLQDWTQSHVLT